MQTEFEIQDFMTAIKRELDKRAVTYPKLLKKITDEEELKKAKDDQEQQNGNLLWAEYLLFYHDEKFVGYYLRCPDDFLIILTELVRKYNMRVKCEIAVWRALLEFWVDGTDIQLQFLKTKVNAVMPEAIKVLSHLK